jgi:hypothetical protein
VHTPLIVAVEPDQQQASQLSSVIRKQFRVELIVGSSAVAVIAKLAGRVPELVLTSALIRPREEATLVGWLRGLGAAAAHVQTVTIPVLVPPETSSARRSGALAFMRDRPAAAPDSCDPAVFADWISFYLDLASTAREAQ